MSDAHAAQARPAGPAPPEAAAPSATPAATPRAEGVARSRDAQGPAHGARARDAYEQTRTSTLTEVAHGSAAPPAIGRRHLPPLREAITDPALPAMDFSSVHVPDAVMDALRSAKRVLVVGHIPPDGDCVGSAAGLAAALTSAGVHAVAVVDDALPSACRAIDARGAVQRADAAEGPFDLVVLVDVAQADRIGGARGLLAGAQEILVVDHHQDTPTHQSLALRPDQKLTTWVDPQADAAAILVGGIAARLGAGALASSRDMLAASMYTDTLGFRAPGTDLASLQLFKGIVGTTSSLDALEDSLRPALPPAAAALASSIATRVSPHGAVLTVDAPTWKALGEAARAVDPRMTDGDLRGYLCDRLDDERDVHGVACMLIDEPAGVRLSTRSVHDGTAAAIATALGGGGHGRSAGGLVKRPFDDVATDLDAAMKGAALAREARVRSGRL